MKLRSDARVLTEEELDYFENALINGRSLREIAKNLGFNANNGLLKLIHRDPIVKERYLYACSASCENLESNIPTILDDYADPQQARVQLECVKTILQYRNPQKYGNKLDLNITQTVDLTRAITASEARVDLPARDVTPNSNDFDDIT